MFTGIIENMGRITGLNREAGNLHITVESSISSELKIDQSVAHNGVCLTVVSTHANTHCVTAIEETLSKTNLGSLQLNSMVNLERCMKVGDRLDGHIVQGHVDQTGICTAIAEQNGSHLYTFSYKPSANNVVVEKGSICINGISLTAFNSTGDFFTVAIIPYTWENTTMQYLSVGDSVNLEFDVIGKYVARMMGFRA
jgi:riboflavin synthase